MGPNGAGKSTLLEAVAGMLPAEGVAVFGLRPDREPVAVRSRLGFMAPDLPVFDLRIGELIDVVAGYYPSWDDARAAELLAGFGLDPDKRTSKLSLGQGTRLRLLLALAFRPRLLLLDEPASGLDLSGRHHLMELLLAFVEDQQCAVVLSSHRLGDVERLSERLLVLNDGAVVHGGATDELVGDDATLEEALVSWGAA